ncbi:MAG: hypothetical protein IKE28_00485 [Solobacterium sp.]|nr:hypothetical protein [Solobacterium sp.]
MEKKTFYDSASGSPLYTAEVPETAECKARLSLQRDNIGKIKLTSEGAVIDQTNQFELYFKNGDAFNNIPMQQGQQRDGVFHQVCEAGAQLDEYVAQFMGQPLAASNKFYLPQGRLEKLQMHGQESISKNIGAMQQVARMGGAPVNVQCTGTILDGAMGVYPFTKDGQQKTLYSAIWRIGLSVSFGTYESALRGMFNQGGPTEHTFWAVPVTINMVSHGPASEDTMRIFMSFVASFDDVPEFLAYTKQVEDANLNIDMQKAAAEAMKNQQMIDNMWAQHNAAWARSRELSKSLSRDMDEFRANLAANSAAMDAFHDNLSSMNSSSSSFGSSFGGESPDDRIQRQRHESIMGVNTYERNDGTTYEHTIMDDRVFENNLDSNTHFGTQNYYGDYVPDGWTELNRKK